MWRNWNNCILLVEIQHDVATVDDSMALPQKAKHELPHELDIPLLGIFPRIKEIFLHPCS